MGLIGIVFSGGISTCGQFTTDFVKLLQVCENKIERFLEFVTCKHILLKLQFLSLFLGSFVNYVTSDPQPPSSQNLKKVLFVFHVVLIL